MPSTTERFPVIDCGPMTAFRQVRADFDAETLTVYQAYSPAIAGPAVAAGTFVPPFRPDRMTWIKPSFLWMMYRCGWATKPGQERVLAVRITRAGFDSALAAACLSHHDPSVYPSHEAWRSRLAATTVRVQWDPERNIHLQPLDHRSLQLGLSPGAVIRRAQPSAPPRREKRPKKPLPPHQELRLAVLAENRPDASCTTRISRASRAMSVSFDTVQLRRTTTSPNSMSSGGSAGGFVVLVSAQFERRRP